MDLSALGKEPIHPDQPSGSDVRYDPLFDQLQAEIDRTSLPSVVGAVDWEKVVRLAAEVLSRKSKDLLVAGSLAVGLIHTRRLDGLAIALKIYRDLIEHHASGLFPERQRGRLRSVEWWLEKSETALKSLEGSAIDPAQLALMEENLEKLGELLDDLLPEAPSLLVLHNFLQSSVQSPGTGQSPETGQSPGTVRSPVDEQPPGTMHLHGADNAGSASLDTDPPPVIATAQASGAARREAVTGAEGAVASLRNDGAAVEEGLRFLSEYASLLRDQDLADPFSYRFARQAAWLGVAGLPPANAGRTLLPAPGSQLRNRLAELRRGGDSTALLKAVEGQLGQFIFWLDLNRLAAEALAELGAAQAAVAAIGRETSFLLQRLPGLDELAFADGTPFADADTREWLKRLLPGGKGRMFAPPVETAGTRSEAVSLIDMEIEAASALIGEGKLIEAVDLLQERIKSCSSGRERLLWRLALSRVLLDAEQARFALPHLEQVICDIDTYRLEAYDPAIALEGLKLAWHGFVSQSEPRFREKGNDALHRIARIDPAEMVRLALP